MVEVEWRNTTVSFIAPSTLMRWRFICCTAPFNLNPTSWLNTSSMFLSVLPTNMPVLLNGIRTRLAVSVGPM